MVVVRGKSPVVSRVNPKSRPEQLRNNIWIEGEGFTASSAVKVGNVTLNPGDVALLPDGRLQCLLPAGLPASEEAAIVVSEGVYDSLPFNFTLTPNKPQLGDYIEPVQDQQQLILPASFKGRNDQQRVPAGTQFNGATPDAPQGDVGSGTGPGAGGFWTFNQKVRIKQLEWASYNGAGLPTAEAATRSAGSGIFLGRASGSESLLVDLANQRFSAIVSDLDLNKGDYIRIVTVGATLEMVANVNHVASSRRLNE